MHSTIPNSASSLATKRILDIILDTIASIGDSPRSTLAFSNIATVASSAAGIASYAGAKAPMTHSNNANAS